MIHDCHICLACSDNLQTAKGTVSHLLIPDALVPCDLDADDRDQLHDTGAGMAVDY